jgi:DNA-binding transcriptional MerR regulator
VSGGKYSIKDLASLGGVSRRTVRYYVQRGLIPPPLGTGRGNHYTQEHLDLLLSVKDAQQVGKSLDQITQEIKGEPWSPPVEETPAEMSSWIRVEINPGVEIHVRRDRALPSKVVGELVEKIRKVIGRIIPE